MKQKSWQILILGAILACAFACTENITEEKHVAIGNRLTSTPEVLRGLTWTRQFTIDNPVSGSHYSWQTVFTNKQPDGIFDIDSTGLFRFASATSDFDNTFGFRVLLSDGSAIVDNYDFSIRVKSDSPILVSIEKTHNTLQGMFEYISITKKQGGQSLGAIECAVLFDSLALQLVDVEKGTGISAAACNWDRIDYESTELIGNTTDHVKVLRLTAIADDPAITGTPTCLTLPDDAEIFRLKFLVSNDQIYYCTMLPIRFVWTGCQQNAAYSATGDTVFLPAEVFDYSWDGNLNNQSYRLTGFDCDSSYNHSLGGECAKFLQDCAPPTEIRNSIFWNGGVDIVCVDSIDDPGDFRDCPWNIGSEYPNDFGLILFFADYFQFGPSVLQRVSDYCISLTDANHDSAPLTIADMVYATRIVVGDALPVPSLSPYHESVTFTFANKIVSSASVVQLGAVKLTFIADSSVVATNDSGLEMLTAYRSGELHILLWSGLENLADYIEPGAHNLVTLSESAALERVEVSDYRGNLLFARYNKK